MIPKIIHYCWFGKKPMSDDVKKYIETWKKYCPNYEIKQWNEDNFNINQNLYCKEAYEAGKWAFVSDYVRLKVLYEYGGIYMDTDIELCKSFDDLLIYDAYIGFESDTRLSTGVIASCERNKWIENILLHYDNIKFKKNDNQYDLTTNVEIISKITKDIYNIKLDNTFQIFGNNMVTFPFEYLCAKDFIDGKIYKTEKTYAIHHFSGSWLSWKGKIKTLLKKILVIFLGKNFVIYLKSKKNKENK